MKSETKNSEYKWTKSFTTTQVTTINIEGLPCYCSVGVDSEEKKIGQKLLIDLHLDYASFRATNTDDIKNTVSYADVSKAVVKVAQAKSHSLIETLAEEIASTLLEHPLILKAKVKIHKPHIPVKDFHGSVSVEAERTKKQ